MERKPVQNREQSPALNWGMERRCRGTGKVTKKKQFLKSMKDTRKDALLGVMGREYFQKKVWLAATDVSGHVQRIDNKEEATGWQSGGRS